MTTTFGSKVLVLFLLVLFCFYLFVVFTRSQMLAVTERVKKDASRKDWKKVTGKVASVARDVIIF